MKILLATLAAGFFYSSSVFAAAGVSWAAKEDYKNPKNEMGLCTEASSKQLFMKTGYCQSIMEILTNKEYCPSGCDPKKCPAALFEQIRDRYLKAAGEQIAATSKYEKDVYIPFNCTEGKQGGKDLKAIAKEKDITKFANVMAQFFSIVAVETSDWDREAKGNGGGQGLYGLSRKDMENPKYRCGCELKNPPDPLPGPEDGHHSLTCGTYMAMVNIAEDGTLYGGKNKRGAQAGAAAVDKDTREGAAKIFKVLEAPNDNNDKPKNAIMDRIRDKMDNYCKNTAHSKVTTWEPSLKKMIGSETFK